MCAGTGGDTQRAARLITLTIAPMIFKLRPERPFAAIEAS
jgi:hypothetical protein